MRSYQIDRLNWMIKLYDNRVNGILVEEIGLCKTLQTISFLRYLKYFRKVDEPHLIIVAKSVLTNWINEIKKFCPTLNSFKFHRDKDTRKDMKEKILSKRKFDICITSYEIATKERISLNNIKWKYIVIDEAHRIKNENSVLSQCVRLFPSQFR